QDANRSPIFGYQHLPLVSLEKTMESIIPIVPEAKEYVLLAKQHCNRESTILTEDESAAIYLYSMPIGFFTRLNESLRAKDRKALKPWFFFLKLFITALEKLPSCERVIWRGVAGDVGSVFVDNDLQTWWSVNSCSKALNVVELYLGETGTVFAVDAKNGKDITSFSAFQEEQEVILMPGSRFFVKSKSLNFRNALYIVHLEEEHIPMEKNQAPSTRRAAQSVDRRINQNIRREHERLDNFVDKTTPQQATVDRRSRYNAFTNRSRESINAEKDPVLLAATNDMTSLFWEPEIKLHLERSLDLRCIKQKPFKARSLPKEMKYQKSKVMCSNNELLLLCAFDKLYLFDEDLKLVRSTIQTSILSSDLVDMAWCESILKFIVLDNKKAYVLDPVTAQLSCIESVQLKEKESCFVSCACSNNKLFIGSSASYYPTYLKCYKLPAFTFVSQLTVTDLIGFDPLPKRSWDTNWATKEQKDDKRKIISIRYNQKRLGIIINISNQNYLYVLNLTQQPIGFVKTKVSSTNYQLNVLSKSGEWLLVPDGSDEKLIQIALDCQFKAECESKDRSQDSFFSFSTGFVSLNGDLDNLIMFGPSSIVALIDDSLALYQTSMASSSTDLGVNEHHEEIIRHYVRFSGEQKIVGLRSFHAAADDFKNQRLSDEEMMTANEVHEFLNEFIDILEKEFEQELTHQYRVNALLIKQLFQQAEQWFLKLNPNFDQLENRRLIDLIRDYEQQNLNKIKAKGNKQANTLMDPINDTKSTILLKTEIQRLQQSNDHLKQRLSKYEKDDELLNQQLEETTRLISNKEETFSQKLESNEKRLKEIQQALLLAENELEKKFNQTNTYINMKRIIEQKNHQIRQLRQQLTGDNDEEEDED
ncbi:unnamed protein product, partial [Rotaria magnacalcarata]